MRLAALLLCLFAHTEALGDAEPLDPDRIVFHVLTIGPGTEPFSVFGHNGLWVENRATGDNKIYSWGAFRFDSPWLVPAFFMGRFEYWLAITDYFPTITNYRQQGRLLVTQELALTREQKVFLLQRLAENEKPENLTFKYDYYFDNCSTRIRDLLDAATDGALRAAASGPAQMSLRDHTRRLTASIWWEQLGLDFTTTAPVDAPISEWEEMFLPEKLHDVLGRTKNAGLDAPIVAKEKVLNRGPASLPKPPDRTLALGLCGLILGAATWWCRRSTLVTFTVAAFFGAFSLLALGLWAATDHTAMYANQNLLVVSPLLLLLLPAFVSQRATTISRAIAWLLLGSVVVALFGQLSPSLKQNTLYVSLLALPSVVALALSVLRAMPSVKESRVGIRSKG